MARFMDSGAEQQLESRIMGLLTYSILSDFHVTFLQGDGSEQRILGSGTLVSIGDAAAILTADHVLAELRDPATRSAYYSQADCQATSGMYPLVECMVTA